MSMLIKRKSFEFNAQIHKTAKSKRMMKQVKSRQRANRGVT